MRLKIDGVTIITVQSPADNVTNAPIDAEFLFTVKSEGVSGTVTSFGQILLASQNASEADTSDTTVDTTTATDFEVTIEWDKAETQNTLTINQGFRRLFNQK